METPDKNKLISFSLRDLASILNIDRGTARAMGKPALLAQTLEMLGGENVFGHVTRCEDCRMAGQYTGDAEADLARFLKPKGGETYDK